MSLKKKDKEPMKSKSRLPFYYLLGVGIISILYIAISQRDLYVSALKTEQTQAATIATTMTYNASQVFNQLGSAKDFPDGTEEGYLGGDTSTYLGIRYEKVSYPANATLTKAYVTVTPNKSQWIQIKSVIKAEKSNLPMIFSNSSLPSSRTLTTNSANYNNNVKWTKDKTYQLSDITAVVNEAITAGALKDLNIIVQGKGGKYGRKFFYGTASPNSPKLVLQFSTSTAPATVPPTITPQASPKVTTSPTASPTQQPTGAPTSSPVVTSTPAPSTTTAIMGTVNPEVLGTCSAQVHDKYVTTGPDGKLYRTWHSVKDPSGCTFAHDHGVDPRTSKANSSLPAFGYIGLLMGDDEPHEGFKVFVENAGDVNDEGVIAKHNSRLVFHMGTGGPKRYVMDMHSAMVDMTAGDGSGRYARVMGMAMSAGAGSICANPRQGRTVMTTDCKTDSLYEIWENKLTIGDKFQAVFSTAVFDPITTMNPTDKTQVLFTKDVYPNLSYGELHGCNRESYHGPYYWYNRGGSTTYYTDAMGKIMANGPLKQEISATSTDFSASRSYDATTNTNHTQFKYKSNSCESGLGLKN